MTKTVLLVEDQNPYLYENLLKAYNGFEYVTTKRGDHALQMYQEHKPVLILMDIRLPMMDGIRAIRQIREIDRIIPIIVITAYETRDVKEKALAAGATDFFGKPFAYKRLYQKMVELVAARPDPSQVEHLKVLLNNKQRRLNVLKERQSIFGVSTPPEILLEIDDLTMEILELKKELKI